MLGRSPGQSPIVTFSRNGKELSLGRSDDDVLHIYGSTGLGIPPVSIATSDRIGGHGAMTRGVRYDVRKLFIPLLINKSTMGDATKVRRDLYRLLAPHLGEVTINIYDPPTGSNRSIDGFLIDGLTGDFSSGFHGNWQTLGLDFQCNSPWWLGEERSILLRLNPGTKPFISDHESFFPVILAQSSVEGRFTIDVSGDEPVFPIWEITGPGSDLVISNGEESFKIMGDLKMGESVRINMETGKMEPDIWSRVSLDSNVFSLKPGANHLKISMANATADSQVRGYYRERFLEAL